MLKVLAIGDIVGKPGRAILGNRLKAFRASHQVDFCFANAENAAGGSGLTPDTAEEIFASGVDVITTGDHVWKKKEIIKSLKKGAPILRPENLPEGSPGKGYIILPTEKGCDVAVILLMGRVFMEPADCPFHAADRVLNRIAGRSKVLLVDMHAEATSEKVAMGYYLDDRVSAVFGIITIATMLVMASILYAGARRIRWQGLERYGHAAAGFAILVAGLLIVLVGV